MRKVILYIAMSLDGYIADDKESVDWIGGHDENVVTEDSFAQFFRGVDTVVMGRKTYRQIVDELSPDRWPYDGAMTYVLTHCHEADDTVNVCFRNVDVCGLVEELKRQPGRDIWVCGGADVARQLIANKLIDIYRVAVIPVILGGGTRLFGSGNSRIDLKMVGTEVYNGIVELMYVNRDA